MLLPTVFCFFVILSIFGYSFLYINLSKKNKFFVISNNDFFYGFLIIIFISLFVNFFFALQNFTLIIFFLGIFFFIIGYKKNIYNIKFKNYFYFLIFINIVASYNGPNVDSPMYHLQTLNWMILEKINLGISNLEVLFSLNSSWHSFIALMNISSTYFSLKFYLSSIIFAIIFFEIIKVKNNSLSAIFLFLAISFLLFFSIIHPFVNGPILNQLGNPEVDIVAMLFYIYSFYLYLKIQESDAINKNELINLFIMLIFVSITTKISNSALIILLIAVLISNKDYKLFSVTNIFLLIVSFFWFLRSFLVSGCLVHPIKSTCFNTPWTNLYRVDVDYKITQSFARDTRLRDKYWDFDYTLNSNDWFLPWVNDYFFNTSILKISSFLFLTSFIFYISSLFFKKKFKDFFLLKKTLIPLFFFIISGYVWLRAPDVRFGYGFIISLPCFFLALITWKININKYFNYKNISIFALLSILVLKNFDQFGINNLLTDNKKHKNYTQIKKIGYFDGVEIYQSLNWQCGDFPKPCVNINKKNYKIASKYNYRIFLSDNK